MNIQIRFGFTLTMIALITVSCIMLSCNKDNEVNSKDGVKMELNFQFVNRGAAYGGSSNIYVSWIENTETNFIQNIIVCKRLVNNKLTGIILPYWKVNKYPCSKAEADAISSPTIKDASFNVDFTLKDPSIKKFSVYFELDRSNEYNDWFTDKRDQGAPNFVQD